MKRLVLVLLISTISFYSCNKDTENLNEYQKEFEPIEELLTLSREIVIECTRITTDIDGAVKPIKIQVIASFDPSTERVTSYTVEQIEEDITTDLEITQVELDNMLIQELGENFTDLAVLEANLADAKLEANSENYGLSTCLTDCHRNFTDENGNKIKGRGSCKFSCWFERILIAIEKILSIGVN